MRGVKYRLKVYASALNWSHGFEQDIEEVHLPDLGIAFNAAGGLAFKSKDKRYEDAEKIGEVDVDDADAVVLMEYVNTGKNVEEIIKKYMPERK